MAAATVSIASPVPAKRRQALTPVSRVGVRALHEARMSMMNVLNAKAPSTPLSRSFHDATDEWMVPKALSEPSKRKRSSEDDDAQIFKSPKSLKSSRVYLTTVEPKPLQPLATRKASLTMEKPAGRSSPVGAKRTKAFGRRSNIDPLLKHVVRKNTSKSSMKARSENWVFDIHVDDEVEEATNTMQHFAGKLDISDDEGKATYDDENKENIPPHQLGVAMPPVAATLPVGSRKNMMSKNRRPLGDLDPSDYYAHGLHSNSYVVFPDEDYVKGVFEKFNPPITPDSTVSLPNSRALGEVEIDDLLRGEGDLSVVAA